MAINPSEKSVSSASADGNQVLNDSTVPIKKSTSNSSSISQPSSPIEYFQNDDEEAQRNEIARIKTNESLQEQENLAQILSRRSTNRGPIPNMGGNRDYPPSLGDQKIYQVDYDGPDDPTHPFNWPLPTKLGICVGLGLTTLTVAWGSSIFSSAIPYVTHQFHVANVVATLGVSLYVLGFASGPVIWSPLSELYGRKAPIALSSFLFTCFLFATATAKDLHTLMLCRFFSGFTGSAPLTVVAASFSDMFGNETRGKALLIFSGTVFCGPLLAPVIGGFIAESYLGWRWTMYITGIMASVCLVFNVFFLKETYHPVILVAKAREIRERTGNWGVFAAHERVELDLNSIIKNNLTRPLEMLVVEPIILLLSIYSAFIYGILYLFLAAYPIVFVQGYKMSIGVGMLPYIGLVVGQLCSLAAMMLFFEPRYNKALAANGGKPVPEARLPPMITGGIIFPLGLFWFTWSGNYHDKVHWIVPTLSGIFTGFGLLSIFLPCINYIVDSYLFFAASALAGNTFLRSSFGAVFPLFAAFMFHGMGTNWAGLLLGLVGLALVPVPILFMKYGKRIRSRSKYAFVLN